MKVKQQLKKMLRSALIFAMVFALCGTTLAKAYATYFPIVTQHIFLDDAYKVTGTDQEESKEEAAEESEEKSEENTEGESKEELTLEDLTSIHEMEMKGVKSSRYSGYEENLKDAVDAGNFKSEKNEDDTQDITLKTDMTVEKDDEDGVIGTGKEAADQLLKSLLEGENSDEVAQLISELQAAMNGGTVAAKYDAERALLAYAGYSDGYVLEGEASDLCAKAFESKYGRPYDPWNDSMAKAFKADFLSGFSAKFRQNCEAMAKGMPEAVTLELGPEADEQETVETIEKTLADISGVTDKQAAAAAAAVAEMIEISDMWSHTSNGGAKITGTNVGVGGDGSGYGFNEATNYMGGAELTQDSQDKLKDAGYQSYSLEIQVVVAKTRFKLDENGERIESGKRNDGTVIYETEIYSAVYVSLDGENWKDADNVDGDFVDRDTVFANGDVELCTYTFTHSHQETAPLRPGSILTPEDPKDPDPEKPDPKDPDPVIPDPKDPDPKDPDPEDPSEEITEPDVPLAEPEIPEEEPPVEEPPEEVELEEPDVPLADIPQTGDISDLWYLAAALTASGILFLVIQERRNKKTA